MIGFIDISLQLKSIRTAHSQWLAKTRSILYWIISVFSSTVTDLVMIYESVTSTATVLRMTAMEFTNELSFTTSGEPTMSQCLTVPLLFCHFTAAETCVSEPMDSNGLPLWLHYSGFQASCHSIILVFIWRNCIPSLDGLHKRTADYDPFSL
jgi:hypothetical protein